MSRDLADGPECDGCGSTRGGAEVEVLRAELARADAAIARTDTKASTLLATFGPIVTVGAAVLPRIPLPPAGRVALWCALVLLMLAVLLLLAVVRPHLRGSGFRTRRTTDQEMAVFVERITADPQRWYRQQLLTISRLGGDEVPRTSPGDLPHRRGRDHRRDRRRLVAAVRTAGTRVTASRPRPHRGRLSPLWLIALRAISSGAQPFSVVYGPPSAPWCQYRRQ